MLYSGKLNLTSPASNRIFQRDVRVGDPRGTWGASYGKGSASVALTISPTLATSTLEYRVRNAADPSGPPLLDWTDCAAVVPAGRGEVTVLLPALLGWLLVDLRANSDDSSVVTTGSIGVGEVVAASGQSLATDFWSNAATSDPATIADCGVVSSPYSACLAGWDGGPAPGPGIPWETPGDNSTYRSSFAAEFLRLAVLGTGVNCGLIGYAWSGEPIASWKSDGTGPKDVWTPLTVTLDSAIGNRGKFGTFIWAQGHNDARIPQGGIDGDELAASQYVTELGTLLSSLASRYGAAAFTRVLSSIPAIGTNWVTTTPKYDPTAIEQIRSAHLAYARTDPLVLGHVDGLDITLWSDGTHPSQQGNVIYARHFYRAFMKGLYPDIYASGDSGPFLLGTGSRVPSGAQIFLAVGGGNGSALSCSSGGIGASSQFRVFESGSTAAANEFALQSVDLPRPGLLVLTLRTTPADDQPLDVWYRLPPDGSDALLLENQIYDGNVTESDIDSLSSGRQLAMAPSAVSVPAPARHRPALVSPGVRMLVSVARAGFVL